MTPDLTPEVVFGVSKLTPEGRAVMAELDRHASERTGNIDDPEFQALCKLADSLSVPWPMQRYWFYVSSASSSEATDLEVGVLEGYRQGLSPELWLRVNTFGVQPAIGGLGGFYRRMSP